MATVVLRTSMGAGSHVQANNQQGTSVAQFNGDTIKMAVRRAYALALATTCASVLTTQPAMAITMASTPQFGPIEDHEILIAIAIILLSGLITVTWMHFRLRASAKRAERAEHLFTILQDNIHEGFVLYDENDRLITENAAIKVLPLSHDNAELRRNFIDAETFDDILNTYMQSGVIAYPAPEPCRARWRHAYESGEGEFEIQFTDGRWHLMRYRKIENVGTIGVRSDITAIKTRELAMQDSAANYQSLVDRSAVPIYVHRDKIILYANAATADMLGYPSADDLVGKNIFNLIHPDHRQLGMQRWETAQTSPQPLRQVEMKFMRFDGSSVITEAQVGPVVYCGEPALESILYDVSARVRTERALLESEQRYRNLFELSPDAILIHDGEHILFANDAAAHLLGGDNDISLFGLSIASISPDQRDCFLPLDKPRTGSCRIKRFDGRAFDAEVVTAPTSYHGQTVHQAVIRDITERTRMQDTMAQNAKLAALGSMAAGLAHELSQPLNIMRFAAEGGLLKMSKGRVDEAQHHRTYGLIRDQSERMATVMDNMRIFSRKDPGPFQPFDVSLALRNIVNLIRNPLRIDDVHIFIDGPVSGIMSEGIAAQLEQVLLNLLKNAQDSILEHRAHTLSDEPGRIHASCFPDVARGEAVLCVEDNGGGIAQSALAHIFDPFFTTKDVGKGTGLGLALSHEIITAMNGTITAENIDGGARFTLRLPLRKALSIPRARAANDVADTDTGPTQQICAHAHADMPAHTKRHILVVEDEVEAARAMAEFLEIEGFKVSVAHNGREGLDAYRRLRPDIVITDVRMPGMDGTALIQALRCEQSDLPIIAVTGHLGETESINAGTGSTPVKVIKKPISLTALCREISKIPAA